MRLLSCAAVATLADLNPEDALSTSPQGRQLDNLARFRKLQAWRSREKLACITISQITNEVRFIVALGEKLPIDTLLIEARHRTAVQSEGSSSKNEVAALKRAVSERRSLDQLLVTSKPRPGVRVWKQARELVIKLLVAGQNRRHWSGFGLFDVAGRHAG